MLTKCFEKYLKLEKEIQRKLQSAAIDNTSVLAKSFFCWFFRNSIKKYLFYPLKKENFSWFLLRVNNLCWKRKLLYVFSFELIWVGKMFYYFIDMINGAWEKINLGIIKWRQDWIVKELIFLADN